MTLPTRFLGPAEAARRLGVSSKALRLYEQCNLLRPVRSAAGWRAYGPDEMARAAEVVAFRRLGLSLAQVARVLEGDARQLEPVLAAHQAGLEARLRQLAGTVERVRGLRRDLAPARLSAAGAEVAFELPHPWGGERFELRDLPALTHVIGPLGSGKTRLIQRLAETLPGAAFLGLERLAEDGAAARARLDADPALRARVDRVLVWLVEEGAAPSGALVALLAGLEAEGPAALVVDMLEQGLGEVSQEAVIGHLRRRGAGGRPIVFTTRSSAILDLADVGTDEAIILCPANHSPPTRVDPHPGAPGYEAVATCLAPPAVRARTEGVIAWRPRVA